MTDLAEKITLYVQRDESGYLLLATTDPNTLIKNHSTSSQNVWIEKR